LSSNLRPDLKIPFKFSNLQLPPKVRDIPQTSEWLLWL
jgi:hypothetical protein